MDVNIVGPTNKNSYLIEACVSEILFSIKNFLRKFWIIPYATSSFYAAFLGLIVMQIPDYNVIHNLKKWLHHNSAEILKVIYSSNYRGTNVSM